MTMPDPASPPKLKLKPFRPCRDLKAHLVRLVDAASLAIAALDAAMKEPSTEARGRKVAAILNALEMAKDHARFFGLDIDYRTGKPRKPPKIKSESAKPSRDQL